jgi:hypothetical protein
MTAESAPQPGFQISRANAGSSLETTAGLAQYFVCARPAPDHANESAVVQALLLTDAAR